MLSPLEKMSSSRRSSVLALGKREVLVLEGEVWCGSYIQVVQQWGVNRSFKMRLKWDFDSLVFHGLDWPPTEN